MTLDDVANILESIRTDWPDQTAAMEIAIKLIRAIAELTNAVTTEKDQPNVNG